MMNRDSIIVVRKRRKKREKGHGSSAWKIAFADFTLSMMAVFLVLWLVSMTTQDQKNLIAKYFQDPVGYFEDGGGRDPINLDGWNNARDSNVEKLMQRPEDVQNMPLWQVFEELKETGLSRIMQDFSGNLKLDYLPQGVRITIVEDSGHPMFHKGDSYLTPYYEDLILRLAPHLRKTQRAITVVGHSDSSVFLKKSASDNWRLSSARANEARRTLVYGGFPEDKIIQITAMADQAPLNRVDPSDSINRRVEFMILTKETEEILVRIFNPDKKKSPLNSGEMNDARKGARLNQLP